MTIPIPDGVNAPIFDLLAPGSQGSPERRLGPLSIDQARPHSSSKLDRRISRIESPMFAYPFARPTRDSVADPSRIRRPSIGERVAGTRVRPPWSDHILGSPALFLFLDDARRDRCGSKLLGLSRSSGLQHCDRASRLPSHMLRRFDLVPIHAPSVAH